MSKIIRLSPPKPEWGTPEDKQLHVVLVNPKIPPNTGNIARLCAAARAHLHLVEPLGFKLEDRYLRRAGLDYWAAVRLTTHPNFEAIEAIFPKEKLFFFSKFGTRRHSDASFPLGSVLVFGAETTGLPPEIRARHASRLLTLPMRTNAVRSLNLSNAVSIALYEALRQLDYPFGDDFSGDNP